MICCRRLPQAIAPGDFFETSCCQKMGLNFAIILWAGIYGLWWECRPSTRHPSTRHPWAPAHLCDRLATALRRLQPQQHQLLWVQRTGLRTSG